MDDGPADLLFPELPPLLRWWEVTFTLPRPGWDGVPAAPGVLGVTASYTAEAAQAVTAVAADGEEAAVVMARGLCSGLGWVAGAVPQVRPSYLAGDVRAVHRTAAP